MHILTIPDSPETAASDSIKPGSYLCEDNNAAEFMLMYQQLKPTVTPYVPGLHAVNNRTLIICRMGFGDAIMLTPVLREMKLRDPEMELDLCLMGPERQIFLGLPYVGGFVEYPPKVELLQDYGRVLFLEHAVEFNLLARTMHMTDRFAQHLGVNPLDGAETWTDNKLPDLRLTDDEREWAKTSFPRNTGRRRLGLQVQAGVRCRSYPISLLAGGRPNKINGMGPSIFAKMVRDGWEIGLMGNPGEFQVESPLPPGMVDMTRHGLTFRQSAAFLTTCDAFLGPDSSLLHVAGTLGMPAVGLFGPFPWKLRTAYYPSVHALHGGGHCKLAPCFHTFHNGLPVFPPAGPCARTGTCEELAAIDPERIKGKLDQLVPAMK